MHYLGHDCRTVMVPLHFFEMRHCVAMPHFGTRCSLVALGCDMTTPLAPHAWVAPHPRLLLTLCIGGPLCIAMPLCVYVNAPHVSIKVCYPGRNSMRGSERFWDLGSTSIYPYSTCTYK